MARPVIEYHLISRLPTCVGNARIRIMSDGRVEHSVNTSECKPGERWSDGWHAAGRLGDASLARLLDAIRHSGLLALPPSMINEDVEDGRREELRVNIDDADHFYIVQNCNPPALRSVVRLLWDTLAVAGLPGTGKSF